MQIYSDYPAARARQIVADVLAVLCIAAFVVLGVAVGALVGTLAALGRGIEAAGSGFEGTMSDAARSLAGVPLIGENASSPFQSASSAGATLAAAGQQQQQLVGNAALLTGLAVSVLPIVIVLLLWLRPRIRFARRASEVRALATNPAGRELLALRALTGRPPTAVIAATRGITADAVASWRHGDPRAVALLAELELRSAGVAART